MFNCLTIYPSEYQLNDKSFWEGLRSVRIMTRCIITRSYYEDPVNCKINNMSNAEIISSKDLKENIINTDNIIFRLQVKLSNNIYKYGDIVQFILWGMDKHFSEIEFIYINEPENYNYLYGASIFFEQDLGKLIRENPDEDVNVCMDRVVKIVFKSKKSD